MTDICIIILKFRSLSDYLGLETMLGVVFKTRDGVKALETYDREGRINKSSGFHGLGASIGRPLDDRYLVICLEDLRFDILMISSCKCYSYSLALLYSLFFFLFELLF